MAVEATHPDAVRLIRTVAPDWRPAGSDLGGLKARTRFQGPVDNLRLFETELGLGAIKVTGEGTLDSRGERPALTLAMRSEETTSELQSLMRISYAVFCLKKKKT